MYTYNHVLSNSKRKTTTENYSFFTTFKKNHYMGVFWERRSSSQRVKEEKKRIYTSVLFYMNSHKWLLKYNLIAFKVDKFSMKI